MFVVIHYFLMGCVCTNPNTQASSGVTFDLKDREEERTEVTTSRSAIVIQSNFRRLLTEKKLNNTHRSLLSQFTAFISNNASTAFVSEEAFLNKISPEILTAKEALKKKITQYESTINGSNPSNTIHYINITEISPVEYIEEYKGIYKGPYKYNKQLDAFYRCGKGEFLDNEGNLYLTLWDNNNAIKNSAADGIIYYPNGNCYMGEISHKDSKEKKIVPNGKGTLYYPSNNYEDYRQGNWLNGKESQNCVLFIKDKYTIESTSDPKLIIIKYINNSRYEGEYIYINDTYIPQGKGTLFIPSSANNANYNDIEGKYIYANWVNGLQSGIGEITIKEGEQNTVIECLFRFGKVIQSTKKMVKHPVSLHKNIFEFLSIAENSLLVHILKTKAMYEYLQYNNCSNLNKIKIKRIVSSDNYRYPQYRKLSNDDLLNTAIQNIDSILLNHSTGYSQFIPIVAYKTNGGMVEARFKYNNIFNPAIEKFFTSNYLKHLDKDILIEGVIDRNIFEALESKDKEQMKRSSLKHHSQNAYLRKRSSISNRDNHFQEDLINQSKQYIQHYDQLEQYYSIEKYKVEIKDAQILNEHIGDIANVLFSIHDIIIQLPKQVDHYSYLTNPVRHIAIYISHNDSMHKDNDNDSDEDIDEALLSRNNYDIKRSLDSKNITPLIINDNDTYTLVEFDSGIKEKASMDKRRLLCLIEIKKYTFTPLSICLKKYYHIGRYISVKLISPSSLFKAKRTCIDMGTIGFYGQIYYLK